MAERSFTHEVGKLRLGAGQEFRGEGILAVTKALLQSGVGYVGGYQGAPISHLMDVLSDAQGLLKELGIHFEASASEAAAAAMLAASVNYPIRGAVTWKSTVGTNVASDALANVASGGVTGGALVIIGEDYGEGSSIMQERSHAFAMKSQMWLLDPRPNLESIVAMVERGFELSEASNTPVMLELRIRACHVYGSFIAHDNRPPPFTLQDALDNPTRDVNRIVLPPASFLHEQEKINRRWPAAVEYIIKHRLNEFLGGSDGRRRHHPAGWPVQHADPRAGAARARRLDRRDELPLYVLNVTYPLIDSEVIEFCRGKKAVLIVEEGQPEYLEQNLNTILRRADIAARVIGKDVLPKAGEYTGDVHSARRACIHACVRARAARARNAAAAATAGRAAEGSAGARTAPADPAAGILHRLPRAADLHGDEAAAAGAGPGAHQLRYRLSPVLDPAAVQPGQHHDGLRVGRGRRIGLQCAAQQARDRRHGRRRLLAQRADLRRRQRGVQSERQRAGRGRQRLFGRDRRPGHPFLARRQPLEEHASIRSREAVKGVGVKWLRVIDRTYDVGRMRDVLREAMTTPEKGPKVVLAASECMLNRQRREKPAFNKAVAAGARMVRERFGVDPDTCTGDHSCIRLSGCPSLTIKPNPDPLRQDPIAHVDNSCVGCGVCGEVAHAAVLCPSFYRAQLVFNPTRWDRVLRSLRARVIGFFQRRAERRRLRHAF